MVSPQGLFWFAAGEADAYWPKLEKRVRYHGNGGGLIMATVSILSETSCRLGEGPAYDPARETLFWFDITERKRYALHMPTRRQTVLDLPEMASAMAVIDDARDLIFTETGLHVLDNATGG
jgi:sugar lactone lactonase YvrE